MGFCIHHEYLGCMNSVSIVVSRKFLLQFLLKHRISCYFDDETSTTKTCNNRSGDDDDKGKKT